MIGVKLTGALEAVTEQIEDHDSSAPSQHAMSARDRVLGMNRVMQRLTQNREVDRALGDRRIFDIAESILKIGEAVLLCEFRAKLNHLRRIIDRDHLAGGFGEELRKRPFSGAEISHRQRREQTDQGVSERLPRTARHITSAEFSGEFIEIFARLVAAFAERELQGRAVARRLWHLASEHTRQLVHLRACGIPLLLLRQPVINIFPGAAIFDHACVLQLRQMARDARLPHAENFLQLRHRKLLFFEEQEQAEPGRVGEQTEKING